MTERDDADQPAEIGGPLEDDNAPLSFRAVDPTRNCDRFDAIIESVVERVVVERAALAARDRRTQTHDQHVLACVVGWSRPTLAAAAVIAIIGTTLILAVHPASTVPATFVETAGVPAPLATWAATERPPSASELTDVFSVRRRTITMRKLK